MGNCYSVPWRPYKYKNTLIRANASCGITITTPENLARKAKNYFYTDAMSYAAGILTLIAGKADANLSKNRKQRRLGCL